MAPTALDDLNPRNELQFLFRRQRFGEADRTKRSNGGNSGGDSGGNNGGSNGESNGGSNGESKSNGGNGSNRGGNGGKDKSQDNGKGGAGQEKDHNSPSSSAAPSSSVAVMESTSTVVVTSVAAVSSSSPSSSTSLSTSIPALPVVPTYILSFPTSATSTAIAPAITSFTPSTDSSNPRKGLNTDGDDGNSGTKTTKNKKHESTVTVLMDNAPSATASSTLELPATPKSLDSSSSGGLSLTSEHVLVAFGAIGAFIMFLAVVYFIARMKKINLIPKMISKDRGREFGRGGPQGWYGWREREMDYTTEGPPPKYKGYDERFDYPSEQKAASVQHQLEAFHSATTSPVLANQESAAALSRAVDLQRQGSARAALLDNPAPFGVSPAQPTYQSDTPSFYSQPTYDPTTNYNQTYDSNAASAGMSRQNSDANGATQREVKYMSNLSSLSSGFGDQIIVPEPLLTKPSNVQASRQSYRQSRRFSWATSAQGPQRDRDTMYTTASIDTSPPRFRTVNSWVAQQTGRVENQDEVPAMPGIPKPLQAGASIDQQRNPSEDPAFRHHPGDEIEFSKGSRIPSTILDKKVWP